MEHEPHEEQVLRFRATDWDREMAIAINDYLGTVEPDTEGNVPGAFVDEPLEDSLGIHILPLDKYSKARRKEITAQCLRIRNGVAYGLTFGQKRPYEPYAD